MQSNQELIEYFGKTVRETRKKRKMKQQELADRVGIKRTSLSHIENAKQRVFFDTAMRICQVLRIEMKVGQ